MNATIDGSRRRVRVLGLDVDVCDYASTIEVVERQARGGGGYICVANVHVTIEAEDDPAYRDLVNGAVRVLPDGTPLVWMQRLQGVADATQVRGPSLMPILMKHAEAQDLRVGFLGGQPDVLEAILSRAHEEFPGLDIAYANSPPFRDLTDEENAEIARAINDSRVQLLFVGLGCPKQERWMAENDSAVDAVMIGVGAAFDLYAGTVREAPAIVSRLGLEWIFRLLQEPRRLFSRYLMVNPRFVFLAGRQLIRARFRPTVPTNSD